MKAANQRGQHVRRLEIEIVARAVKVRGHERNGVESILRAIGRAQLESRDLGDGVGFVGGFQRASEQIFFLHRLGREPRINARRTQKQQLADAGPPSSMNQVGLNSQIVVEEFSGMGGVRENAADFGRGEKHEVRALFGKKVCDGGLVAQIKLRAGGGKNTLATTALELPKEGRPHQSAVSGYISAAGGCESHWRVL